MKRPMRYPVPSVTVKMANPKTCACGVVHTVVPTNASRDREDLLYWNCVCNSTLVYAPSYSKAVERIARRRGVPLPYRPSLVKSSSKGNVK